MAMTENSKNPDMEFYQELLLKRFGALRQQNDPTKVKSEEERVELALSRIRWGNYRNCMECGDDIGDERLMANPTTLVCIECARTAEGKING